MTVKLEPIKEALSKGTPGPWKWNEREGEGCLRGSDGLPIFDCGINQNYYPVAGHSPSDEDLVIIVNAPEWIACLVAQLEEAQKTLELIAYSTWEGPAKALQWRDQACETLQSLKGDQL